jgi:hypothetical protein
VPARAELLLRGILSGDFKRWRQVVDMEWKAGLTFVERTTGRARGVSGHLISWVSVQRGFDSTSSRIVDSFALIGLKFITKVH